MKVLFALIALLLVSASLSQVRTPSERVVETPTEVHNVDTPSNDVRTPTDHAVETPTRVETNTPTEHTVETPTERTVETPTRTETHTPTEHTVETPTDRAVESPTRVDTHTPTERVGETPTRDESHTPTEHTVETPTERAGETPTRVETHTPTERAGESPTRVETHTPTERVGETPTRVETHTPTERDVDQTPVRTEATPTADLPCSSKSACTCLEDAHCHFCEGTVVGSGLQFAVCGFPDHVARVCPAPDVRSTPCSVDATPVARETPVPSNDRVTNDINAGRVTEADVNNRIASDPVDTLIIVVTIITQAESRNGKSHFQTFVDVTGDVVPTPVQRIAICESLKRSLSAILHVDLSAIDCGLTERITVKRITTSYIADMTVDSEENGAGALGVAVALVASPLALLFN